MRECGFIDFSSGLCTRCHTNELAIAIEQRTTGAELLEWETRPRPWESIDDDFARAGMIFGFPASTTRKRYHYVSVSPAEPSEPYGGTAVGLAQEHRREVEDSNRRIMENADVDARLTREVCDLTERAYLQLHPRPWYRTRHGHMRSADMWISLDRSLVSLRGVEYTIAELTDIAVRDEQV